MIAFVKNRDVWIWSGCLLFLGIFVGLVIMSHQANARFYGGYCHEAGWAFCDQAGFMNDSYYQDAGKKKPAKIDYVAFVNSYYGRRGRWLFNANALLSGHKSSHELVAIIEERTSDAPGPFFIKPFLRLVGWKPIRMGIYADAKMRGIVPQEFKTIDLTGFVSSDDLRTNKSFNP
jgi:hypothetical protein